MIKKENKHLIADIIVDNEKYAVIKENNRCYLFEYIGDLNSAYTKLPVEESVGKFIFNILLYHYMQESNSE